jgi:two-component system sensor histidine kinase PhoQ
VPQRGLTQFERTSTSDGEPVFAISMLVDFELADTDTAPLVFTVAESLAPFQEEVGHFRGQLFGWFAALTVVLLAAQALLMRVVLRPLRRVEREIREIEDGDRSSLGLGYPAELRGVTENLNALIAGERARLERYRDTLGNLAHSLKTPLAVMRASLEHEGPPDAGTLSPQVERMNEIVGYQLQRAAAWGGGATLGRAPIEVARVIRSIEEALQKVYAEKKVIFTGEVAAGARFYGEEGDLMELAGNLLDNAFKWCRGRVTLRAGPLTSAGQRRAGLVLVVEDDGRGIDEAQHERVLERGVRADERTPGHGIGLAVVHDIVRLHGGELAISRSDLGGARVEVRLPAG